MSDKNNPFSFSKEEKSSISSVYEDEKFPFFLKTLCLSVLFLGTGFWFVEHQSTNENARRTIQSVEPSAFSSKETISIESFVVRFKTENNFQLTKIDVTFQVDNIQVSKEIQEESGKITDHLIFILSDQNISMFNDAEKLRLLKKEIVTQLNLFLVTGKIENVELKKTFLN